VLVAVLRDRSGCGRRRWNVRHAREVGGRAAPIDLCYLDQLGPSAALLPLIEMEQRARCLPELLDRSQYSREFHSLECGFSGRLAELDAARRVAAAQ
jgi:hypothetical protein